MTWGYERNARGFEVMGDVKRRERKAVVVLVGDHTKEILSTRENRPLCVNVKEKSPSDFEVSWVRTLTVSLPSLKLSKGLICQKAESIDN